MPSKYEVSKSDITKQTGTPYPIPKVNRICNFPGTDLELNMLDRSCRYKITPWMPEMIINEELLKIKFLTN